MATMTQCWSSELGFARPSGGAALRQCKRFRVRASTEAQPTSTTTATTVQFDLLARQNESNLSRKSPGRYGSRSNFRHRRTMAELASEGSLDSITQLHKQLEGEPPMHGPLEKDDLEKLNKMLEEKARKGLSSLMKQSKGMSYTVDPDKLVPGEYVVHKKVGVGQFVNVKEEVLKDKNSKQKYVFIRYADGMAKLPAKQAHRLLYRYFREGEAYRRAPSLSKLSDRSQWEKRKNEGKLDAQTRVVKMIDLYVRRLKLKRPVYPKHAAGIDVFAAKFPYTPTRDQLKAFVDVEKDMTEQETPMDRLICGDVGFGKTEVAMRAIFHAISAQKQVMVLAPTTVLAKQHHDVIRNRFAGFPNIKVALLSRFQNSFEKKEIIAGLNNGLLHIIVGTHALLGKEVDYQNVGLLVVDEEQRFGVAQKEKIASLKCNVDMLTLSATPIPRTLHMALSGFRDASLISTPPPERRPITTHVCVYSKDILKKAIETELQRNGQVFYVVPRIQDMKEAEKVLHSLVPGVNIFVAHGQKTPTELEETMQSFIDGGANILLCTSIIESGLDIPTVNTIIIENVHMLGLAQIYQLRGRVGRADKASHAYLLHPRKEYLSCEASMRLKALEECCALGQGFQLAERDMAIRGIGSIFGEKQSGFSSKLGVDLFAEMLFEALSRAQFHSLPQLEYDDVQISMEVSLSNGKWASVIDEAAAAARQGLQALVRYTEELRCERGKEPVTLATLLKLVYAKRLAADLGIHRVHLRPREILMQTNMNGKSFNVLHNSMTSEQLQSSLVFAEGGRLELRSLVELATELQLDRLFSCLADLRHGLPSFLTYR